MHYLAKGYSERLGGGDRAQHDDELCGGGREQICGGQGGDAWGAQWSRIETRTFYSKAESA
jgi:hypothetical protein